MFNLYMKNTIYCQPYDRMDESEEDETIIDVESTYLVSDDNLMDAV
jgi:hypothetical protein